MVSSFWGPASWAVAFCQPFTGVPTGSGSKFAMGNGDEFAANVALKLVVAKFSSGANTGTLGGRGSEPMLEKPNPAPSTPGRSVGMGSSSMSWIAGLGERLCGGPRMVGMSDSLTGFDRLCPGLRALGLPLRAEGLPTDIGAGSYWNAFPLLLRVEDACVEVWDS